MSKFIFEMPDDMGVLVEAFRVKRGHKATAVAVRELISTGLEVAAQLIGPIQVRPAKAYQSGQQNRLHPARGSAKPQPPNMGGGGKEAAPFKSRLKGEWKAP